MKLPIGIQSFEEIRTENYYYVDKTKHIFLLVNEGKYYFLSRPRRFGKSLFLDTLRQAFLGKKELFEGLYLEKNWDWSKKFPVLKISFGGGVIRSKEELALNVHEILNQLARDNSISLNNQSINGKFREIIEELSKKTNQKVVILIDEYDKPILDTIEKKELAREIRDELKNFYSVLKDLDEFIKFVFITGVSKFSKVSLFSGLNHIQDISLNPKYSTLCGYTEEELVRVFANELKDVNIKQVQEWYNGYNFLGERVYNPFDVLLYFTQRQIHPYWFESGTPSFLIKLLIEKRFYIPNLEELVASENLIGSFDVDFIEPENLLFQTGYLTIKKVEPSLKGFKYYLGYPNKEVKISLNDHLLAYYTQIGSEAEKIRTHLENELNTKKVEGIYNALVSLFSSIPYEWYRRNEIASFEGYYASVVYSFFAGAGFEMVAEDYTNRGRIDLTIFYEGKCFIIEFKVVESEKERKEALNQIQEKKYHKKYETKVQEIYLIGIEFSKEKKNIINFEWEGITTAR